MSKATGVAGKTPFALARSRLAAQRQASRDVRTPREQLSVLETRPGNSTRERRRLLREAMDEAAAAETMGTTAVSPPKL